MLRLIVIVISIACLKCSIASGQQILRGKIIEFGNSEYIPYANISLTQNEGTASDISGNFLLPIRLELAKGKLVISSIGYETKSLSLDSLLAKGEVVHQIFLKPVSFLLQEVAVQEKKLTPVDIVKEALIAITKNYLQDPFNMEFYSRVTTGPLDKPEYLSETIVKTYRSGYRENAQNFSRISHKRITGINPLPLYDKKRKLEYFAYENLPGFDVFLVDLIGGTKLQGSIFNPDYFKRLEFRHLENTRFENDTVTVIEYDVNGFKPDNERSFRGKLYISTRTLAILRHERRIGRS
ncbi:MAG TPA: carboxypeptidase-like regulatory domain-containing protein, partial [Cyclobacteriaceae bacterium]|nr:carboxypeptidase-like regulatory domain-containing protein [Cyclobacteriaceae bacterium]